MVRALTFFMATTCAAYANLARAGMARSHEAHAEDSKKASRQAPLAWISFPEAEERYDNVPYLWLGRVTIQLTIDVPPGQPDKPAHKITLTTTSPRLPEAFPEMRAIWDRQPPPPTGPVADERVEGLFRQAERNGPTE